VKLSTFSINNQTLFGFELQNSLYPFEESNNANAMLRNMQSFLENFPKSHILAESILDEAKNGTLKGFNRDEVMLHAPLPQPAMLIDFALTPQHLLNSALTFVEHEYSGLKKIIARKVVRKKVERMKSNKAYPYYKANHTAIIGNNDTVLWPSYTSYLDIEPELAVIIGANEDIAGYTIFNDFSARDIQVPELDTLSLTRSKDFRTGNGFGPFMVTANELQNPLSLSVNVSIGNRFVWKGNTCEYSISPQEMITYLKSFMDLKAGTIIGMGTIPFCCGLDNNLWINPGEEIRITFDSIGTLIQHYPSTLPKLGKSRWAERDELKNFIEQ